MAYFGVAYSAPTHLLSFSCPGLLLSKGLLELQERERGSPQKAWLGRVLSMECSLTGGKTTGRKNAMCLGLVPSFCFSINGLRPFYLLYVFLFLWMNPGTRLFKVSSQSIWLAPDFWFQKEKRKNEFWGPVVDLSFSLLPLWVTVSQIVTDATETC